MHSFRLSSRCKSSNFNKTRFREQFLLFRMKIHDDNIYSILKEVFSVAIEGVTSMRFPRVKPPDPSFSRCSRLPQTFPKLQSLNNYVPVMPLIMATVKLFSMMQNILCFAIFSIILAALLLDFLFKFSLA